MMSASPERTDPSTPVQHHHHASPSKRQPRPQEELSHDKKKKSNFEDCRDFVSAEKQNEKRGVNNSTREFLQELDDLKRGVFERDAPASRHRQRREARPRSVCERDSRASVFCFDGSSLAADGRSLAADGDERASMREHDKDGEGRLYQGAGIKVPSNRMSTGLQVSLTQPGTASVATSTPIASSYTSGNDAHWTIQQPGAPHSPGALSWHGEAPTSSDKSSETGTGAVPPPRLSRKESYKAQRQNYRREKKKAASALLSTLEDPAVLILADWLKVRGSLKSWTKLWCVLKPGLLLLYKSPKAKSNHWVGTVLLSACQVIERPSKKDGFCFKLYNPLEQSIWAPRGPHNETIGAVVQPLPTAHLIFRAPSQAAGKCWLDGLELALRCSNTMLRTSAGETKVVDTTTNHETQWSPEDLERHFNEQELEGAGLSESDSEEKAEDGQPGGELPEEGGVLAILKNVYADETSDHVPQSGEVIEELGEENKSLLWFLIKQVRPGMDLSKVVLPTFILEPRSFLDKLSDSFYHSDILARACRQSDPYERMKTMLTWYLSGLYRKPRGLKKPYNPVLGETFRCCWLHPDSDTRTYYVSEQVSHHPPVSAFYVSNRKEGFAIEATILAKSKFYGNSTSAILEGLARVALLPLAETYLCTSPYAHCKGLLLGTLSMELGGRVTIHCPATDYTADIDFKLKPFIGGSDSINMVSGRIRHFKETVATIEGHWDGRIDIRDKKTQEESLLMDAAELKTRRLRRQLVVADRQAEFESQRLWRKVSEAIAREDQVAATEQKTCIEESQRERARDTGGREWQPRYFSKALYTDGLSIPQSHGAEASHTSYQYSYHNFTPWDESVDVLEYEEDFVIKTLRRQAHALPSRSGLQARTQPETEHSASETDSTNSHHNARTPSQSQQSVAAALLRMEAALREQRDALVSVSAAVKRLEAPAKAPQGLPCATVAVVALLLAILGQALTLYYYSR